MSIAAQETPYHRIGGADAVRKLVDRFYDIMEADPKAAGIRAMHAADLAPMRESLAEFLCGWLGGPRTYFERKDRPCVMSAHGRFDIGPDERDQWLYCMHAAIESEIASAELRVLLAPAFTKMADNLRSR